MRTGRKNRTEILGKNLKLGQKFLCKVEAKEIMDETSFNNEYALKTKDRNVEQFLFRCGFQF